MAERLGNVLYWASCVIAVALVALGVSAGQFSNNKDSGVFAFAFFLIVAVVTWVIGRALRYILRGQ